MRTSTNNTDVRRVNRNRVFRFINHTKETCMSEISSALEISGPTVMSIVKELKEAGVIREVGEYESTGGRKAKAIASVKDFQYTIGVDITLNHVGLVYTDLSEEALAHRRIPKPFRNDKQYIEEIADIVEQFVEENDVPQERILGMGVSLPAIIDQTRQMIPNSHVLGYYDVPCEEWISRMPYPCVVMNDASAAALAEVAGEKRQESMVYLLLSNSVGGAVFLRPENKNGDEEGNASSSRVYTHEGDNWRSSEFGHMTLYPGGEPCYCGKKGCVDVYCSAKKLAELENGKLERFFEKLEEGEPEYRDVWDRYLDHLAVTVDNLRMAFDCDVVLGGYVGSFIGPYIKELRSRLAALDIFDHDGSYARACRYQKEASALGAALYQMEEYISSI